MPGFFVTSMCSIVLPRYLPLSAFWFALRGVVLRVLSCAIVGLLLVGPPAKGQACKNQPTKRKQPPRAATVCSGCFRSTRHCGPGWLRGVVLSDLIRGRQAHVRR